MLSPFALISLAVLLLGPTTSRAHAAGTQVATSAGGRGIETLRVGERVATLGEGSETQVDASWVTVALRLDMRDAPGTQADITLLRPASWLLANGVHRAGDRLRLRLAEIGMEGVATVISIRGPPEVEPGPGRVVLGVISHVDHDVYIARFEGTALTVRVTGAHRFYALAREAWLPIAEVQPGEALQTRDGALVLKSLQHLEGMERVYNIEVESEHEYLVSELAVRTHNTCAVGAEAGASAYQVPVRAGVNGRPDPARSIDTSRFREPYAGGTTKRGFPRDSGQFWDEWARRRPQDLSDTNLSLIGGRSPRTGRPQRPLVPRVDDQWIRSHPEHAEYLGTPLVHHHVDNGRFAIPVPAPTHVGSGGPFHGLQTIE